MRNIIAIILVVVLFYFLFRGEHYSVGYNYVKLWDLYAPWATYSAADGEHLSHTFRKDTHYIEYDFSHGPAYMEFWGYAGAGDPKIEDRGDLNTNPNWRLIISSSTIRELRGMYQLIHPYHAYRIVLNFSN